ncbi:ABC transporter permease [Microbacterium sp. NPDC003461]
MSLREAAPDTTDTPSIGGPARTIRALVTSTPFYVAVAVILLAVIFALMTGGNFLSITNLQSIGRNSAGLILLAVGLTFVLGAGHIDLSVGATLVLSSVVAAKTTAALSVSGDIGVAIALGALAALVTGAAIGLLNGLLVTKLKINSFVVTLGTMGIGIGAAQVITNGANVTGLPAAIQTGFGMSTWFGIPLPLLLAIAVGAVCALILWQTVFGRHALAVGSAQNGARRAGVRVQTTTVGVFVLAGTLSGLAGFLDISRFGTTAISGHETTMLQALSAVIIGGTSLFGGRASVLGAVIATFITTVLTSGFVMIGVSSFYQRIAVGVVLIIAVWVDRIRRPASQRE